MSDRPIKQAMLAGAIVFFIAVLVLYAMGAARPYFAGIVVAFIIFELAFFHLLKKESPPPESNGL